MTTIPFTAEARFIIDPAADRLRAYGLDPSDPQFRWQREGTMLRLTNYRVELAQIDGDGEVAVYPAADANEDYFAFVHASALRLVPAPTLADRLAAARAEVAALEAEAAAENAEVEERAKEMLAVFRTEARRYNGYETPFEDMTPERQDGWRALARAYRPV